MVHLGDQQAQIVGRRQGMVECLARQDGHGAQLVDEHERSLSQVLYDAT
jgi:hypothetical protein